MANGQNFSREKEIFPFRAEIRKICVEDDIPRSGIPLFFEGLYNSFVNVFASLPITEKKMVGFVGEYRYFSSVRQIADLIKIYHINPHFCAAALDKRLCDKQRGHKSPCEKLFFTSDIHKTGLSAL